MTLDDLHTLVKGSGILSKMSSMYKSTFFWFLKLVPLLFDTSVKIIPSNWWVRWWIPNHSKHYTVVIIPDNEYSYWVARNTIYI